MDSNWCMASPIISTFVLLLCFTSSIFSVVPVNSSYITHNLQVGNESRKANYIKALLKKINKPFVKTFQVNGDVIDCVPSHLQPAFDHPLLKGQKPLTDPTKMPKGQNTSNNTKMFKENFQVWSMSGESCPENTIPIKRTTEQDLLRATSVKEFGQKIVTNVHEHAIGITSTTGAFFGAKAHFSVWDPTIEHDGEFSLSQIWVIGGTQETIEAGWQVYPRIYGDSYPRLFVYWTRNGYQGTGCYNLQCPGFVQTSSIFVLGGRIQPVSSYNGAQNEYIFLVWKDPNDGNWWLKINDIDVGYWPSSLFSLLKDQAATMVHFGGEIINSGGTGAHTKTEMGSGHFPSEGYGKAAYIRNIELVDEENKLYSAPKLRALMKNSECYSVETFENGLAGWGSYLFFGGSGGANPGCT